MLIKDNVKKRAVLEDILNQGDMFYHDKMESYYIVTFTGYTPMCKEVYNLYNVNKSSLYYYESKTKEDLAREIVASKFIPVKEGSITIEGRLY